MEMKFSMIPEIASGRWPESVRTQLDATRSLCVMECGAADLPAICKWLSLELEYSFAGLIVEEGSEDWEMRYVFYGDLDMGWVHVLTHQPLKNRIFPSISAFVHAADWHEREAEDLFGLSFEGHPRLGDFVLHNDRWCENLAPMRHHFDGSEPLTRRKPDLDWRPQRIVEAPGAFAMPIGPKFSGITESVHFLLETVGEDVIRTIPRLFYKYRAVEKMLRTFSSFLDRLEEVGIVSEQDARSYGLLGPVARASGVACDLRSARPYSGYEDFAFDVPSEQEGDGYARLRVLFAETRQSLKLMEQAVASLPRGQVMAAELEIKPGAALGWVETPRGAAFHWLRIDDNGRVARYRLITPSFANWHGFHLAAEQFAFQDFPIILATFDLSVAENDRCRGHVRVVGQRVRSEFRLRCRSA